MYKKSPLVREGFEKNEMGYLATMTMASRKMRS